MIRFPFIFLGAWTLLPLAMTCSAQAPTTQAHPKTEWKLADAPINLAVKKRIVASLIEAHLEDGEEAKDTALQCKVTFVHLTARNRIGIEVEAVSPWVGGTGNHNVRIYDRVTGSLLVDDFGWDFGLIRTLHHGVYDFYIRESNGRCDGSFRRYNFDGKVYQEISKLEEKRKACP